MNVPVYVVPGNWDWTGNNKAKVDFLKNDNYKSLIHGLPNIIDVQYKRIELEDFDLIGYGVSSGHEYPQYEIDKKNMTQEELTERMIDYKRIVRKLSNLFDQVTKQFSYT